MSKRLKKTDVFLETKYPVESAVEYLFAICFASCYNFELYKQSNLVVFERSAAAKSYRSVTP